VKISVNDALVTATTPIAENHGQEEIVHGISMRFECQVPPRALQQLSRKLPKMFFAEDDIPTEPNLGEAKWRLEYENAHVFVNGQEFHGVDVKKITVEARAGFLVDLGFSLKIMCDDEARGKLTGLLKHEVKVVIEKATQKRIEDPAEDGEDGTKGNGKQGALPEITPLLTKEKLDEAAAKRTKH
jgi:hypothetical protein